MFPRMPMETGISTNSPRTSPSLWSMKARVSPATSEVIAEMITAMPACFTVARSEPQ